MRRFLYAFYGCVVPQGAWHTVEVLEPSVIYEAKAGWVSNELQTYVKGASREGRPVARWTGRAATAYSLGRLRL